MVRKSGAGHLDLLLRISDGDGNGEWVVDQGCYEYHPSPCGTDFDADGDTDLADVEIWFEQQEDPCPLLCPPCFGDLNGDCVVDTADLMIIANSWGPCGLPGSGTWPASVEACFDQARGDAELFLACLEALIEMLGGGG